MVIDRSIWKSLLRQAVPLGGGMVLRQAAWQVDILLLTWLAGLGAVGLFSGPFRIIMAINLLPLVLAIPLYPMFARLAQSELSQFRLSYERGFKFLCLISLPITTFFLVWADPLIPSLLGSKYQASVPAFQILSVSFIPLFASTLFPFIFTALGYQRIFMWTVGTGLGLRILLNIVLIPRLSFIGSCIAVILSETAVLGIGVYALGKTGTPLPLIHILWRPILAVFVMGTALYFSKDLPIILAIPGVAVSGLLYLIVLLGLKTFSVEEVRLAKEGMGFLKPFLMHRPGKL